MWLGGDPTKLDNDEEWVESIKANPVVVQYALTSLAALVDEEYAAAKQFLTAEVDRIIATTGADIDGLEYNPGSIVPGVVYNLTVLRGVSNPDKKFFSVSKNSLKCDLFTQDDFSGRQRLVLTPVAGQAHTYTMVFEAGVSKSFVSVKDDGSVVDAYQCDDGSGRQHWVFTNVGSNVFTIAIAGGIAKKYERKKYLSTPSSGDKIDLYDIVDDSGRQQWVLTQAQPRT